MTLYMVTILSGSGHSDIGVRATSAACARRCAADHGYRVSPADIYPVDEYATRFLDVVLDAGDLCGASLVEYEPRPVADQRAQQIRDAFVPAPVDVRPCLAKLREHALLLYRLAKKAPAEWTAEDVQAARDALDGADEVVGHVDEVVRGECVQRDGAV